VSENGVHPPNISKLLFFLWGMMLNHQISQTGYPLGQNSYPSPIKIWINPLHSTLHPHFGWLQSHFSLVKTWLHGSWLIIIASIDSNLMKPSIFIVVKWLNRLHQHRWEFLEFSVAYDFCTNCTPRFLGALADCAALRGFYSSICVNLHATRRTPPEDRAADATSSSRDLRQGWGLCGCHQMLKSHRMAHHGPIIP